MQHKLEEFYRKNRADLVRRITNRAGGLQNAEDVVQSAFLRAWQYRDKFKGDDMTDWFNGILSNCLKDFHAEERRIP